ncbi:MAG: hypothetical protein UU85_C0004G0084 [Candidatus Wolfebacteria bacterium GW2011_GWA2_42_10]|uniref:Uncharacterized protein n=2 Tax=Candidatus Wolfeibacteriota TaxID=1752735 RepID=A0A0G0XK77_9BACT|nr:MAG: hypothetical protein UU38_C0001G0145 [Candidatus Wolfebacteria bacterium GW2011_GWB1_41_12]KKS25325.1 MAG: hypothetical protein UU85_C0004G0084 [Candidatus Wolfebacteria bacterium GW2011_GWA2_42_10]KKT56764.1 MAG: hypothetical protein UW50_C0001G0333 [Candidatus Wolfebacteria bacterium GW2011_GWA1_44_24]
MIRRERRVFNKKRIFRSFVVFAAVFVVVMVMAFAIAVLAKNSWGKEERNECLKWQKEAREIQGYFLANWQAEQCARWGVKINAPIKADF